jgi:hypothetical protein
MRSRSRTWTTSGSSRPGIERTRAPAAAPRETLLHSSLAPADFNDRQKAALAYAEAIAWHLDTDDGFWPRLYDHFTQAELVELGCMIGLTLGQQAGCGCSTSSITSTRGDRCLDGARLREPRGGRAQQVGGGLLGLPGRRVGRPR